MYSGMLKSFGKSFALSCFFVTTVTVNDFGIAEKVLNAPCTLFAWELQSFFWEAGVASW